MATLTLAADIAWRLGANEALALGTTILEPAHLLVGILGIEKVFSPDLAERMKLTEFGLSTVRVEWEETLRAVTATNSSPAMLRRDIRASLPKKSDGLLVGEKPKVNRSAACKDVFVKAGALAERAGSHVVGIRYLVFALLDGPPLEVSKDLREHLERLKTAIAPLVTRPLHTPISSIEDGYVSEHAIAPTIDRRRAKA